MPLVSCDSSSESEFDEPAPARHVIEPTIIPPSPPRDKKRKRGLPKLPSAFSNTNSRDDPSQHQGRTRSRPFVEGDYNAHIYISLPLPAALRRVIQDITSEARGVCPGYTIHSLVSTDLSSPAINTATVDNASQSAKAIDLPLHISLTHPLPLRASQLLSFRDEVRTALRQTNGSSGQLSSAIKLSPLRLSLAAEVVGFVNGRRSGGEGRGGRGFIAIRIAAGSKQIEQLVVQAIHPILAKQHLPLYHSNPQFHASFAWTLLDQSSMEDQHDDTNDDAEHSQVSSHPDSPTPFTSQVLDMLSKRFGQALLSAQPAGGWGIDHLELKLGKDIHSLHL